MLWEELVSRPGPHLGFWQLDQVLPIKHSDGNTDYISLGFWSTPKIIKSCNECPGRESLFAPFTLSHRPLQTGGKSQGIDEVGCQRPTIVALLLPLPWNARDLRPEDRHFEGAGMRFCFQHCSLVFSSGPSLAMTLLRSLNHWNATFFTSVYVPTQGLPDRSSFWTCNKKSLQDRMSMKS